MERKKRSKAIWKRKGLVAIVLAICLSIASYLYVLQFNLDSIRLEISIRAKLLKNKFIIDINKDCNLQTAMGEDFEDYQYWIKSLNASSYCKSGKLYLETSRGVLHRTKVLWK